MSTLNILQFHTLLKEIDSIVESNRQKRSAEKLDFNFFTALVSGKYAKEHIEKYHSNFIAYLLDPTGLHGFGDKFLTVFLDQLGITLTTLKGIVIEREHSTHNGRFIDIVLKQGNEIPLFIENKVGSSELYDQMKDYFEYACKFNNLVGIYLTLNGSYPKSISNTYPRCQCVSYLQIRNWLLSCRASISMPAHIDHVFRQYIEVLNSLLKNNNMEGLSIDILKTNKEVTSFLFKDQLHVRRLMEDYMLEVKSTFLAEIQKELSVRLLANGHDIICSIDRIQPTGLNIVLWTGILLFSGNEEHYGLGYQFFRDEVSLKYSSASGYGDTGNAIYIDNFSAHYGLQIDCANSLLSEAYIDKDIAADKWQGYIKQNVEAIWGDFVTLP